MSEGSSGNYRRPDGNYVRPSGRFFIDENYRSVADWPISSVSYHQTTLERFRGSSGTVVVVELVPEPGNPYDSTAVACDIDGVRVGYLAGSAALRWHDITRAANLDGFALMSRGEVLASDDDDYEDVGISIPGLTWSDLVSMAIRFGLLFEFEEMLRGLTEGEVSGLFRDDAHDPDPQVLRSLYEDRSRTPKHSWAPARTPWGEELTYFERMPHWMGYFLKHEAKRRREERGHQRRLMQAAARAERQRERDRAKQEAATQRNADLERRRAGRLDDGRRALRLSADGFTIAQIAEDLALTPSQTSSAMAAARKQDGVGSDWHAKVQAERRALAAEVVRLQRSGLTVQQIGARMNRSRDSVRELLSDGKFYENPESRPERLELARQCSGLRDEGKTKPEVLVLLGVSRMLALRAFRDSQVLVVQSGGM